MTGGKQLHGQSFAGTNEASQAWGHDTSRAFFPEEKGTFS